MKKLTTKKVKEYMSWRTDEELKHCPGSIAAACNDAINYAVENYNFDNADSYELDFSLDYDSRIQAESINLTDTYELVEAIVTNVEKQFKIEQDEEI